MSRGGFPRYAVLKCMSNNKYVRCTADGSIRADGDDVLNSHCKFQLERAKTLPDFLNIRSCYNNKYWVAEGPENSCLKARASKPDEDPSHWQCTSFCIRDPTEKDHYVCSARGMGNYSMHLRCEDVSLFVGGSRGDYTTFAVIDWESLVILPEYLAFKTYYGDYLAAEFIEEHEYLEFNSKDYRDQRVQLYEIFPTGDGSVRIKSAKFNKFWRRSPNWIWADSSDTNSNDKDTVFVPVKCGNNGCIALRNLGNNNFCVRLSKEFKENCLNADEGSITHEAIFTMEEPVLSRHITLVSYRLWHARIYDEENLTVVSREAINYSSVPETVTMRLVYQLTSKNTWERGLYASRSVPTTIKAGIPMINDHGEIQVKGTIGEDFKWGETIDSSRVIETTRAIKVPPRTRVKLSLFGTRRKCDVPFSYVQRDIITTGRAVSYHDMDDGLFNRIDTYNFRFETTEHKL